MSTSKLVCDNVKALLDSEDGKTQVYISIPKHLMRAYKDKDAEALMYYKNRAARREEDIKEQIVPILENLLSEDDAVMLYTAQDVVNKFNTTKELLKDWIKEKKDRIVLETVLNTWIAEEQNTDDGEDGGDDAGNQNQDTGDDNGDTGGTSGDTGQDAGDGTGDDTSGSGDGGDDTSDTGNDTGDGDGDTGDTQGNGNTDDPNDIDNP